MQLHPCNDKQPVSTSTCRLPYSDQRPTPANSKWSRSKNRCTIHSMSPNPPPYMLRKTPRFIPGLGTLALLAVGGFVVGKSSVKDSNVSTTEPAQRTPWPPPLHDVLDDAIRPYVRSRFQTREVSHGGRQNECTDRNWVCVLVLFLSQAAEFLHNYPCSADYGSRQIKDGNQPTRFYFLLSDQGKR